MAECALRAQFHDSAAAERQTLDSLTQVHLEFTELVW